MFVVIKWVSYSALERQVASLYFLVQAVTEFVISQHVLPEMDDHAEMLYFALLPPFNQGYLEN